MLETTPSTPDKTPSILADTTPSILAETDGKPTDLPTPEQTAFETPTRTRTPKESKTNPNPVCYFLDLNSKITIDTVVKRLEEKTIYFIPDENKLNDQEKKDPGRVTVAQLPLAVRNGQKLFLIYMNEKSKIFQKEINDVKNLQDIKIFSAKNPMARSIQSKTDTSDCKAMCGLLHDEINKNHNTEQYKNLSKKYNITQTIKELHKTEEKYIKDLKKITEKKINNSSEVDRNVFEYFQNQYKDVHTIAENLEKKIELGALYLADTVGGNPVETQRKPKRSNISWSCLKIKKNLTQTEMLEIAVKKFETGEHKQKIDSGKKNNPVVLKNGDNIFIYGLLNNELKLRKVLEEKNKKVFDFFTKIFQTTDDEFTVHPNTTSSDQGLVTELENFHEQFDDFRMPFKWMHSEELESIVDAKLDELIQASECALDRVLEVVSKQKNFEKIKKCCSIHSVFTSFLEDKKSSLNINDTELRELLDSAITPTQRIMRYRSLFEGITEHITEQSIKERYNKKLDTLKNKIQEMNEGAQQSKETVYSNMLESIINNTTHDSKPVAALKAMCEEKDNRKVFFERESKKKDYESILKILNQKHVNFSGEECEVSWKEVDDAPLKEYLDTKLKSSDACDTDRPPILFSSKQDLWIYGYSDDGKTILNKINRDNCALTDINVSSENPVLQISTEAKMFILSQKLHTEVEPLKKKIQTEYNIILASQDRLEGKKKRPISQNFKSIPQQENVPRAEVWDAKPGDDSLDKQIRLQIRNIANSLKNHPLAQWILSQPEIQSAKSFLQTRKAQGVFWSTIGVSSGIIAMEALAPHWSVAQTGAQGLAHFFNQMLPNLMLPKLTTGTSGGAIGRLTAAGTGVATILVGLVVLAALAVTLGYGAKQVQETYQNCRGGGRFI